MEKHSDVSSNQDQSSQSDFDFQERVIRQPTHGKHSMLSIYKKKESE